MYATLLELRRYLTSGGNTLPATDDDLLNMMLDDAQLIIDGATFTTFEALQPTTRQFDALTDVRTLERPGALNTTNRTLWLDGYLAEAPTTVINGDGIAVLAADYVTEPRRELPIYALTLKSGSSVTWTYDESPEDAIAVTGYWAYSRSADALIRGACLSLAAWGYRQRTTNSDADRPLLTGDGVVIMQTALPKHAFERLMSRKRLV